MIRWEWSKNMDFWDWKSLSEENLDVMKLYEHHKDLLDEDYVKQNIQDYIKNLEMRV